VWFEHWNELILTAAAALRKTRLCGGRFNMAQLFGQNPLEACGLVVVFPDDVSSLWDSGVNLFVDEVEQKVDGAFVTFAMANGRHPSLVDALTAARFNGCDSAIVVVVSPTTGDTTVRLMSPPQSEFPITVTASHRDAESVAGAYLDAMLADPAVCA
jgi:hypothetical protein